jgi:type II secretory pathway component PulK
MSQVLCRRRKQQRSDGRRPAGIVLVIVLVVVAVMALAAYTFTDLMVTHRQAAQLSGEQLQAKALVDSGVDATRVFLLLDRATREEAGGLYDNPTQFQGVLVVNDADPKFRGCFTIVAPTVDDVGGFGGVRYGLEDESTRLNLNTLMLAEKQMPGGGRTLLMAIPGMTEDVADAILDWIDEDDEPRELGAEVDYYSGLSPAYAPRNGPMTTVEELLLVRGVTPQLLFGLDVNRNGIVDSGEMQGSLSGVDNADGSLDRGWSAYLTLYSQEKNVSAALTPRIYLNGDDMQALYDQLSQVFPEDWVTFIVAYRLGGDYTGSQEAKAGVTGKLDLTASPRKKLDSVLDLVGAKTQVRFEGDRNPTALASPFSADPLQMGAYMELLMDNVTVSQAPLLPGRININQAPRAVLMGIPGMTEEIVNEIISRRDPEPGSDNPHRRLETWILQEAIVTLEEMKSLSPFINGGGDVYRGQVVGYFQGGNAAARAEVIFDATGDAPRVLLWRDISHLGRGYPLETLGVLLSDGL